MIIVSQDKRKIVNFDNLTQIYITQDEEETAYFIRFETVDSLYDDLGKYKTEERAKEVLKDLILRYEAIELKKTDSPEKEGYTLSDYTPVYEMPVEKVDDK